MAAANPPINHHIYFLYQGVVAAGVELPAVPETLTEPPNVAA